MRTHWHLRSRAATVRRGPNLFVLSGPHTGVCGESRRQEGGTRARAEAPRPAPGRIDRVCSPDGLVVDRPQEKRNDELTMSRLVFVHGIGGSRDSDRESSS